MTMKQSMGIIVIASLPFLLACAAATSSELRNEDTREISSNRSLHTISSSHQFERIEAEETDCTSSSSSCADYEYCHQSLGSCKNVDGTTSLTEGVFANRDPKFVQWITHLFVDVIIKYTVINARLLVVV